MLLNLLVKDIVALDGLVKYALDGAHDIISFIHSHTDVCQRLRVHQGLIYECVLALPLGCETRFATKVLELGKLLKSKEALVQLANDGDLRAKYTGTSRQASQTSNAFFSMLVNLNFWKVAGSALELLQPIADVIHHVEADRPAVSQLRRIWQFVRAHTDKWWMKHRSSSLTCTWEAGFEQPAQECLGTLPERNALAQTVFDRSSNSLSACFTLAHLLDARLWIRDKDVLKPDTSFLSADLHEKKREIDSVKTLVARIAGEENKNGAVLQLSKMLKEGIKDDAVEGLVEKAQIVDEWKVVATIDELRAVWEDSLMYEYPCLPI